MAKKPFEQLSPAYRKRIENALAKGKTRQQARGHKQHEHIERKQKEVSRYGLTSSEKSNITKFFNRLEKTQKKDDEPLDKARYINYWRGNYPNFLKYKQKILAMHKEWLKLNPEARYDVRGPLNLIAAAKDFEDVPDITSFQDIDLRWFYYH